MLTSGKSTLYVNAPVYTHTHTPPLHEKEIVLFSYVHTVLNKNIPHPSWLYSSPLLAWIRQKGMQRNILNSLRTIK